MTARPPRPAGVTALAVFFLLTTLVSFTAALSLLSPDSLLDRVWALNPGAREALESVGRWAVVLLLVVSAACSLAGYGLLRRLAWGRRLAIGILVVNMLGDFANVFFHGDARSLIGLPIAGILTAYLMHDRAKRGESLPAQGVPASAE